ncbi:pre-piRNA 3'-exonuclease trimmer [Anabrus simplex]|uniref:pre-piRNA 3'-exonuclease trimmer n=1 Tax=Anabrus simplex TaxID=316456 RepID=UPI0034DD8D18
MCEILRGSFDEKYPEVEGVLQKAAFIAIDNEFTGLVSNSERKLSLFDAGSERYSLAKANIEEFIAIQVGITAFNYSREENKYIAHTFTIPVFPRSISSLDHKFLCQASSLEYLCQYKFDFNKVVYEGVPYLNADQERKVRKELKAGALFRNLERTLSMDDERKLQAACSRVAEWFPSAVQGDRLKVPVPMGLQGGMLMEYVLHKELRKRFPVIWTYTDIGCVQVEVVSREHRQELEMDVAAEESLQENLINHFLGFSRIYKLLINLKKPIIGHNMLLDLMMMYNQFYEPLPSHYSTFKKNINQLFPVIYDTKFISSELKRKLKKDLLNSTVLSDLYAYFKDGRGSHMAMCSPVIQHSEEHNPSNLEMKFHEAGWDSYCTGFCFIKMSHIFAEQKFGDACEPRPFTSTEHLFAVQPMKNNVNVIRADVSHICLDGPDPKSERPQWLHVHSRNSKSIDISQVAELFAKFGTVDVKSFSKQKALVAVGNHRCARDILQNFRKHDDFRVTKYSPFKHSPVVRALIFGGAVLSGGTCVWIIYDTFFR